MSMTNKPSTESPKQLLTYLCLAALAPPLSACVPLDDVGMSQQALAGERVCQADVLCENGETIVCTAQTDPLAADQEAECTSISAAVKCYVIRWVYNPRTGGKRPEYLASDEKSCPGRAGGGGLGVHHCDATTECDDGSIVACEASSTDGDMAECVSRSDGVVCGGDGPEFESEQCPVDDDDEVDEL